MGIPTFWASPFPKTLVIWASPSHNNLAIWVRVSVTGDAHITRRLKSFPWDALVYGRIMVFYMNLEKLGKPERCVML